MKMLRRITSALLCVLMAWIAASCAKSWTIFTPAEIHAIQKKYEGRQAWLRCSMYFGPLYGDESKVMLTPMPFENLFLVQDLGGGRMDPGKARGIIKAGGKVTITRVEIPEADVVGGRLLTSPRYYPWVYLRMEPALEQRPFVFVVQLPMGHKPGQLEAELAKVFSDTDPNPEYAQWDSATQLAVGAKRVEVGMPEAAAYAALGPPFFKRYEINARGVKTGQWIYPTWPARTAIDLEDGRVIRTLYPLARRDVEPATAGGRAAP